MVSAPVSKMEGIDDFFRQRPPGLAEGAEAPVIDLSIYGTEELEPIWIDGFNPHGFAVLFGPMGAGATLLMSAMLHTLKGGTRRVLANYGLKFADKSGPEVYDHLYERPYPAPNSVVGLDDLDIVMRSRRMRTHRGESADTVRLKPFLEQAWERGIDVIATCRTPRHILPSLVENHIDYLVLCELVDGGRAVKTYWRSRLVRGHLHSIDAEGDDYSLSSYESWRQDNDYSFILQGTDAMFDQYDSPEITNVGQVG